jgi:septal ring factor EnvC (AmiA/AmiB activator)
MRNVLVFILLFTLSSCLVPKNHLILEQTHIMNLQRDSLKLSTRLNVINANNDSLEKSLELTEKGTKELIFQIDSMKIVLDNFKLELDSIVPRLKKTSIERDVWRIETIRLKQDSDRLKFLSDSLLEISNN